MPQRAALGVGAVGRRDDEEGGIRRPQPCSHVPDEVGVARGVEEGDHHRPARQRGGPQAGRGLGLAPGRPPGHHRVDDVVEQPGLSRPARSDEDDVADARRAGDGGGLGRRAVHAAYISPVRAATQAHQPECDGRRCNAPLRWTHHAEPIRARLLHQAADPGGRGAHPARHQPRRRHDHRHAGRLLRRPGLLPARRVPRRHPRHHGVRLLRHRSTASWPARSAGPASGAPTSTPPSTGSATPRSSAGWCSGTPASGDKAYMAALALACLILGSVVSYAKARAEGLGMTANVGIAERADRLVVVLVATGFTGLFDLPEVVPRRRARPARPRQPRHRRAADARGAPPGPGPRVRRRAGVGHRHARPRGLPRRAGAPCAGCRNAPPTRSSTGSPTSPSPRGGAARMRSNYAKVRPDLDDAGARRPGARRDASLPALLLRGLPPADPERRRPARPGAGRGRRPGARGHRRRRLGHRVPRPPRQLGPRRRLGHHPPRPGHDRRRAAEARGGLRGVPRLPRVARDDDPPAHRRGERLPGAARGRPPAAASSRCSPTATSPPAASRSSCAATPARMAPGPAALALAEKRPLHPVSIRHERRGRGLGHRHHLPPGRRRARDGHHPRARHRDDPGLRRRARGRDHRAHQRLAHAAAGLPRRPRPRPPARAATRGGAR